MVNCPNCGKKIELLRIDEIPLDVDGEEIGIGSYEPRPLRANQKFREEKVYGCRDCSTEMNEKELLELKERQRAGLKF
jgi:DNA-directed RNA polymerase subunit RPC12/RpoP